MPPAISEDEFSETDDILLRGAPKDEDDFEEFKVEADVEEKPARRRKSGAAPVKVPEPVDDEDEDEDDDEELDEDEFIVEAVKNHMIDEFGEIRFHVKWEGYEDKKDMTWEPEESLMESASAILEAYFDEVGGREAIFEDTKKGRGKKRGRPATEPAATTKRSRKNGTHPASTAPPATAKKWSPPAGSWEDEIETIDACEEEKSGKLIVYLNWKNGHKTKHETAVVYKKCPQKMLQFYEQHVKIIRGNPDTTMENGES